MNLLPVLTPALLALALFARKTAPVPPGEWGGEHIQLTVTAEGATAELDCAHFTISAPLRLDKKGRFAAQGTWVREHGGPIRVGEGENVIPARFTGAVRDRRRMTLVVAREDDGQSLGSFHLGLGERTRLHKCR